MIREYILGFLFFYLVCFLLIYNNISKTESKTILEKVQNIQLIEKEFISVPLGVVRLGNHMWKYASGYGIAKTRDSNFCVEQPTFRFEGLFVGPFVKQCKSKPTKTVTETKFGYCDNRFYKKYDNIKHIGFRRYFQCHNYFDEYRKDILSMFKIQSAYKTLAKEYLKKYDYDKLTCFHYRLGDMARKNEGMTLPPKAFYLKVLSRILKTGFSNHFLIISDEPSKALKNLFFIQDYNINTTISKADLRVDFTIMATLCDNIVFSRGTFAWWAAYLNTKATVYYRDEFENNYLSRDVNRDTYYLPEWIKISI